VSDKQFDVTLVGEANIDLVLYGLPDALPVERELLADNMAMVLGGSPAITAHNLASLGSRVGLITPVAEDAFGQICVRDLEAAGVDISRKIRANGLGTGVTVLLQHEKVRRALTYPGATLSLRFSDLDLAYLSSAQHFHLSSYFLQANLRPDVPRLFRELKQAGLSISLDTNDDPMGIWDLSIQEALAYVDILMPNEREACELTRTPNLDLAVRRLSEIVPLAVVKRGVLGALAVTEASTYSVEAHLVSSIDAIGAGDSFNAGFLHGYVSGWPVERCLEFGNLAGAYSTTAIGGVAAFRDRDTMQQFFAKHANNSL